MILDIGIFRGIIKIMEARHVVNAEVREEQIHSNVTWVFVLYFALFVVFRRKLGDDVLGYAISIYI